MSSEDEKEWNNILNKSEFNLVSILQNEHLQSWKEHEHSFWKEFTKMIESSEPVTVSTTLQKLIREANCELFEQQRKRTKKLSSLGITDDWTHIEGTLVDSFEFVKDLVYVNRAFASQNVTRRKKKSRNQPNLENESDSQSQDLLTGNEERNGEEEEIRVEENNEEEQGMNNSRLTGTFVSNNVFNLSKRQLTEAEISVLSKGLQFSPTPRN